jgi:hypothetical protein
MRSSCGPDPAVHPALLHGLARRDSAGRPCGRRVSYRHDAGRGGEPALALTEAAEAQGQRASRKAMGQDGTYAQDAEWRHVVVTVDMGREDCPVAVSAGWRRPPCGRLPRHQPLGISLPV